MPNTKPIIFESQAALVSALNNIGPGDDFGDLLRNNGHLTCDGAGVDLEPSSDPVSITPYEKEEGVAAKYAATLGGSPVAIHLIKLSDYSAFRPSIRGDGSYTSPATIDNLAEIADAKGFKRGADLSQIFSGNMDRDGMSDTALGYVKVNGNTTYLVTLEGR